jgi:phosphoribosyl 1,2-cyclic phosphate phosphodiesterase
MKITFLGTSAAGMIPVFRCACPVCSDARQKKGKAIRQHSSAFIETDSGPKILIDMPVHIKAMLESMGIDDLSIDIILFSHYHGDHAGGSFHLLDNSPLSGFQWDPPVELYMPEDMYAPFLKKHEAFPFFFPAVLKDRETVTKGRLQFQALNTNHLYWDPPSNPQKECHGYLFNDSGKRYAYMVDASPDLPAYTLEALKENPLDCLVYENTFKKHSPEFRVHMDCSDVLHIHELLKPKRMILTHIDHVNMSHDELTRFMQPYGIEVAWDGMIAEI